MEYLFCQSSQDMSHLPRDTGWRGAWQSHTLSLYNLLYSNFNETILMILMKSSACLLEVKALRRFGADILPQAGGLVLFNHNFLACEKLSGDSEINDTVLSCLDLWGFTAIKPANTCCPSLCLSKAHILLDPRTFPSLLSAEQGIGHYTGVCCLYSNQPQSWEYRAVYSFHLFSPKNPLPLPPRICCMLFSSGQQFKMLNLTPVRVVQTEGKDEV